MIWHMCLLPLLYLLKWSNFNWLGWKTTTFFKVASGHHGAFIPQLFRLRPIELVRTEMDWKPRSPAWWFDLGDFDVFEKRWGKNSRCCTLHTMFCLQRQKKGIPNLWVLKWNPNINRYEFAAWPCEHGFCVHTNHGSESVKVAGVIRYH